jgi:hypothetical protein
MANRGLGILARHGRCIDVSRTVWHMNPTIDAIINAANNVASRVVNWTCPAWNTPERWSYPDNKVVGICWATLDDNGQVTLTGDMNLALPFICERCGYMRLHMPPADLL